MSGDPGLAVFETGECRPSPQFRSAPPDQFLVAVWPPLLVASCADWLASCARPGMKPATANTTTSSEPFTAPRIFMIWLLPRVRTDHVMTPAIPKAATGCWGTGCRGKIRDPNKTWAHAAPGREYCQGQRSVPSCHHGNVAPVPCSRFLQGAGKSTVTSPVFFVDSTL